jgi:hypothetical protein
MADPVAAWNFDEASGTTVLDRTGNGHDLTISGIGVRTASGNGQTLKGLTASGGGQMNGPTPNYNQTAQRTIMASVRNTSAIIGHVLECYVSGLDSSAWSILFLSGQIHIQARNSSGFARASATWTPSSTWRHIAGTYDGTNIRLYIDGVLAATTALTAPLRTDADAFRVLDNSDSVTTIDNVRIYTTALTGPEILALSTTPVPDAPPANQGTLVASFSSPTGDLSANGSADGVLTGSFSSPIAAIDVAATAEVTVEGTFAAPVTAFDVRGLANAELTGDFSSPTSEYSGAGIGTAVLAGDFSSPMAELVGTVAPEGSTLFGSFSSPSAEMLARAWVNVSILGTFSIPVLTATGGVPIPNRDILFTIGPGERPATSIEAGPATIVVAQGNFQRTKIGA